jgi:hypothetical protein
VFGFSFDVGRWMFDVGRSSFYSVLNVQYWVFGFSFDVGRWMFDVGRSSFHSMLDVHLCKSLWAKDPVNYNQKERLTHGR